MHLIIPFAAVSSDAAAQHLLDLKLPNLRALLTKLRLIDSDVAVDESFSAPHERVLAKVQGLPVVDGYIPWAAQEAAKLGLKGADSAVWGWVSLCNYCVGSGSMTLEDPAQLHVTEAESRQLLADMTPYFVEDGITLHYVTPARWLACGEPLQNIPTASLDRVVGRDLDAWQPEGGPAGKAAKLRRLQNEMQMLLYTHTVNEVRSKAAVAARLPLINSIWLHGTGQLPAVGARVSVSANLTVPRGLVDAALREDWAAWAQAWQQLDATLCADLLKRVQAGESAVLTLCGERSALTYELRPKSAWEQLSLKLRGVLGIKPAYLLPKQL